MSNFFENVRNTFTRRVQRVDENLKYLNKIKPQRAIDDDVDQLLDEANLQQIVQFLADIKLKAKDRETLVKDYEVMAYDSLVGSAIELLADDATQEDDATHRIVWVEAKRKSSSVLMSINGTDNVEAITKKQETLVAELNGILTDMEIDKKIWTYAYNVIKYGEQFLNTYDAETTNKDTLVPVENSLKKKRGFLFDIVDNPLDVCDLEKYGDTVGYAFTDKDGGVKIYDKHQFIHFINDKGNRRTSASYKYVDEKLQQEVENTFKIKYGTSYLETARQAYMILDLCEEIILAVRFGRSAVYRLFKIEVGGASKAETAKMLREFKMRLSEQESMNVKEKTFSASNKPVPYGSNIYIPTRSGKGDVTQELVGGDVDFKDMVDVEYFRNKLFAALKVPKAFLGFEEAMAGGIGNQTLTKTDIRYARSVKRIKAILKQGIKDMLCYHWYAIKGKELDPNLFDVCMAQISTADESDKRDDMMNKTQLAESIKQLCQDAPGIDQESLIKYIIDNIIGITGMYSDINAESSTEETNKDEKKKKFSHDDWE